VALALKDTSEPDDETEGKPVENEENGEPDEEVRNFLPYLYVLLSTAAKDLHR